MTLPTGTISLSQVNTELGRPAGQAISLNDSAVRGLAGKSSGAISMNDLRGKSAVSISINGGFSPTTSGQNQYTDIGSFSVSKTGGGPITSYSWATNDYGGQLGFFQGANTANYSMRGQAYNYFEMTQQYQAVIGCTVVIDGVSYYAEISTVYTAGSGL